jgi:uncharacterized protein with ParB-like and HNH nuclease domain
MENIKDIFRNTLFRIPDYQRGYAWGKSQLEDFWQDIANIIKDRKHYTGVLTVEDVPNEISCNWTEEQWYIQSQSPKVLYVVDGQQRITTVSILIKVLLEFLEDGEEYLFQSKEQLSEEYLYKKARNKSNVNVFGYENENINFDFFSKVILGYDEVDLENETYYTDNLIKAKLFFKDKVDNYSHNDMEKLFKKLTQQVTFNIQKIEEGLNTFVVFESMNNRGKSLTFLEKLKNRLVYLSTLVYKELPEEEGEQKAFELRKKINDSWKVIYKYLGKNKLNVLDDDDFIKNHWIVYNNSEFEDNLAEEIYTLFNPRRAELGRLKPFVIEEYVYSIKVSIQHWFYINNPEYIDNLESKEILLKIKELKYKHFKPIILASFLKYSSNQYIPMLNMIEKHLFLFFVCSRNSVSKGKKKYYRFSKKLYKGEYFPIDIVNELKSDTYGKSTTYDVEGMKIALVKNDKDWKIWDGIKYFMKEYNNSMQRDYKFKNITIKRIIPEPKINKLFSELGRDGLIYYKNTLGNLTVSSNKSDTYIEAEIKDRVFGPDDIKKRGIKLLEFMELRWEIVIGEPEKKQLLGLSRV